MTQLPVQVLRYCSVGLLNTAITIGVIALLLCLSIEPMLSNGVGSAAGLANSFLMNKRVTFGSRGAKGEAATFLIAFALAYSSNLLVLHASAGLGVLSALLPSSLQHHILHLNEAMSIQK